MAKKKMLQFSPELSDYLEDKINKFGYPAEKKKMFGHETFFLNGYMFTGANISGIFVHTGKEARDLAIQNKPYVTPFEPMEGMVMKDYLILQKPIYTKEKELKNWLDGSRDYLFSLPPKEKKPGKRKR